MLGCLGRMFSSVSACVIRVVSGKWDKAAKVLPLILNDDNYELVAD